MEIFPGVHQIVSEFGGRHLFQYLFLGRERSVLLDTGVAATPNHAIFPYLESLGRSPRQLDLALTLHPDLDHQGGNAELRDAFAGVTLACHRLDRHLIADPEVLYSQRYNHLAACCGAHAPRNDLHHAGRPVRIDWELEGNERIELEPGWELTLWHVPGHADGHLAVYDARHRAAFTSDAVQGLGNPLIAPAAGPAHLAFGPTYYTVSSYLATIAFLERQPIEQLWSGHWPAAKGAAVANFLHQSRQFVERVDALLPQALDAFPAGAALMDLVGWLAPRLGDWPRHNDWLLMWPIYGHLLRAERASAGGLRVRRLPDVTPWRWQRADPFSAHPS